MQPVGLSKNEKLVLYGLVRYPEYNDVQVSEHMGVKRPTVTRIKNKLREAGLYTPLNVLNYYAAGGRCARSTTTCLTPTRRQTRRDAPRSCSASSTARRWCTCATPGSP